MISRRPRWDLLVWAFALTVCTVALWAAVDWQGDATGFWSGLLTVAAIVASLATVPAGPLLIYVALFVPRRADDKRWRETVHLYRSWPALKSRSPTPNAVNRAVRQMSAPQLAVAAILPDHSAAGRAAAEAELDRRGIVDREPPIPNIPGFLQAGDLQSAERSVFGLASRMRGLGLAIGATAFAAAMALLVWNILAGESLVERALMSGAITRADAAVYTGESVDSFPPALKHGNAYDAFFMREQAYTVLIVLGAIGMAVYFLVSWLRKQPLRILLLRKFNDRSLGKSYRHLIQAELAPFGHVIALSDRRVKRPYWAWLATLVPTSLPALAIAPLRLALLSLLRSTDRTRWGPAFVADARDFRNLSKRLHDRFELNTEVLLSANAYLVRTTDAWWKLCIQVFLTSADVIVLDLSQVTEGTSWEIASITRLGLWERVVLIANETAFEEAEQTLLRLGEGREGEERPEYAHIYRTTGDFIDRPGFRLDVFAALRRSVLSRASISERPAI